MSDWIYVAVALDDRVRPVIADTPQEAAEKAAESMDLRVSASDLSNWKKMHDIADEANGRKHWRISVRAHHWEKASIHGIEQ